MNTRRWLLSAGAIFAGAGALGAAALHTTRGDTQTSDLVSKLTNDPAVPALGNPVGRVALVEFFDYRCPYCRIMQPRLDELLAKHTEVRLVLREWPVFGGVSVDAAKVALASAWQGRFAAVHAALFGLSRGMDIASIRQAAVTSGMDLAQLDHDLASRSAELDKAIGDNTVMARSLGFEGTPGFIVGRYKVPGALSYAQLEGLVVEAGKQGRAE